MLPDTDVQDRARRLRDLAMQRSWILYVILGATLTTLYFAFPAWETPLWTVLGMSSSAATVIGVRRHRPHQRIAWYLLAAAIFCFALGDTVFFMLTKVFGEHDPFPSVADIAYLAMYPLLAVGVFLMVRTRSAGRDFSSLIDALIITTGLGLLSWTYLVTPNWDADGLTTPERLVSSAYPLGDILVLAMLARLVAGGGMRVRAMMLLTTGAVALIVADVAYGLIQLGGNWSNGGPTDALWAVFYISWGAAALHPSMTRLTEIGNRPHTHFGPMRMVVLGSASLIGPVLLMLGHSAGQFIDPPTVAVFSAVLFVLVVLRMANVLGMHQQSMHREGALRSSSEALVAARELGAVYDAAVASVRSLIPAAAIASSAVYVADDADIRLAAGDDYHDTDELRLLWRIARAGGCLTRNKTLSVTPLGSDGDDRGMLIVTTVRPLSDGHHHALTTLAAQVGLASEGVRLTEHLAKAQGEAKFRGIIQNASDVIIVVDERGTITYGTPSIRRGLGYEVAEVTGTNLRELVHPDDLDLADTLLAGSGTRSLSRSDWRLRHHDGHFMFYEVVVSHLEDDTMAGTVFTMRDVTHRRALEKQLEHQAFHDSLTGLPNRSLFQDRVEGALARAAHTGTVMAMAMVDLDDFKLVNDTRGHGAGDSLLIEVADRLKGNFRAGVTIARLGGDEFAILLEDLRSASDTSRLVERLLRPFAAPFDIHGEEIAVTASVGLAVTGGASLVHDHAELLRCADLALYAAKERGKGCVAQYHDELHSKMMKRMTHRVELTNALESDQFILNFQPIVSIDTADIVGSEVLVRWEHPTRGIVAPSEFIPLTEETGLIVELGKWVIDSACAQWRAWTDAGVRRHYMSINVSARQLEEPGFAADVLDILRRHRIPQGAIVLELTESMFALDAPAVSRQLSVLREAGIRIAVDDFGTGYSSLAYLRTFPIDILKVDKSFVDGLGIGDSDGGALTHAIVSLAHALHLDVIAEGIETIEQRDELRSMGCSLGQGYLYARPMRADALLDQMESGHHRAERGVPALRVVSSLDGLEEVG
jgi:diguanylate cyclase (GGDEF)-like protein/PAS domain S-box-containing protein